MKTLTLPAAVAAATLCAGMSVVTFAADGFLPRPCQDFPGGDHVRCPTPYVELEPDRYDEIFERNFLCRETDYSIGVVHGGGCGTSFTKGWSLPARVPTTSQETAEDRYRAAAISLFKEFLLMKEDGVFLDPATIKMLGPGYEFPNTTRGENPPGGFFARPPGSTWLERVQHLRETGPKFVCFDIPPMPSGTGVCGFDLISLYAGIVDRDDVDFLEAVAAKFWLAAICYESPEACEPHFGG